MESKKNLVGYASGVAGVCPTVAEGPRVMQQSVFLRDLNLPLTWEAIITPSTSIVSVHDKVRDVCQQLASTVSALLKKHACFTVLGGDHTAAIGTWSGVYDALHHKGELGLIWIDAHMDSHTPATSETGRLHGMPLACLLGQGDQAFTGILHAAPKFRPENVCLVGVRSFESGEAELLDKLGVKVYFMEEVRTRGIEIVLQEAVQHVGRHTMGYGISLDLDGIDPRDAPAVDVPEPDGIHAADLLKGLRQIVRDPRLLATEIVEFDPSHDINHQTEKLVAELLQIFLMRVDT